MNGQKPLDVVIDENTGTITMAGSFGIVDAPNLNGHVYPKAEMELAVQGCQGVIRDGRMFGQFGDVKTAQPARLLLTEISHKVTSLKGEDDRMVGTLEVLDTPAGRKLAKSVRVAELMQRGGDVGFRFYGARCGTGRIEGDVIQDYKLNRIDLMVEGVPDGNAGVDGGEAGVQG